MSNKNHRAYEYDGGFVLSPELKGVLDQPGFISEKTGGQKAREIYRHGTIYFHPERLSPFTQLCFSGTLGLVKKAVESKEAPLLSSTETSYKRGYAMFVLFGAERIIPDEGSSKCQHLETLQYLISQGLPVDVVDIAGWTALTHMAMSQVPQPEIARVLLEAGANPNHQGRYGDVPLFAAIQQDNYEEADLLLQYNADLDILEADGFTPRTAFTMGGPKIVAVFQRHIWKREGKGDAPRLEKRCDHCKKTDVPLRNCAKCKVAPHCGIECQRAAWTTHKKACQPFGMSNTATFKPHYREQLLVPTAHTRRERFGWPPKQVSIPTQCGGGAHVSKDLLLTGRAKSIIIKVQVPQRRIEKAMLVYTKNATLLAC